MCPFLKRIRHDNQPFVNSNALITANLKYGDEIHIKEPVSPPL